MSYGRLLRTEYTRRLATANRSRVSIRCRPCKCFASSLITTQNSVVVSHTLCAHVRGPENLVDAGAPPHYNRGVADPLDTRYSFTYVITPNSVAIGQTIWALGGRKNLATLGHCPALGSGVVTPRNMLLPTCLTALISVILGQTVRA